MARVTVAQRRQRRVILTVAVTAGVSFAAGVGVALWSCNNLPGILASLADSAWKFGLVFIVTWLIFCLIRAFVTACQHTHALMEQKREYADAGWSLIDGKLALNGEVVES